MVQFNLLPDIKLQFIKAQRTKYLVTFVSIVVSAASIGLLIFSIVFVHVVQEQLIKKSTEDINKTQKQILAIDDVKTMLTVQNQLNTLPNLHESKGVPSRIFTYLQQTTPLQISLDNMEVDFENSMITIGGNGPSIESIRIYADALKLAHFHSVDNPKDSKKAFSEVVSNISRDEEKATFSINLKFDPDLFDVNKRVELRVMQDNQNQAPFQGESNE